MRLKAFILSFVCIICFNPAPYTSAESKQKPQDWGIEQGKDIPLLGENTEKKLDDAQVEATNMLFNTANWIDSFFDDGRYVTEENESRATLKLSFGYSKKDQFETKPRADIRLKLPKLSSRALLVITAEDDSDFEIEDDPVSGRPRNDDSADNDVTAALRFFLQESEKYNVIFDIGGSWNYLYGSMRYRAVQNYDDWLGRFTNRLRWYTDDGWENKTTYDMETHLSDTFFFRSTGAVNVYEGTDGFPHSVNFKLFQVYSSLQAFSYETGLYYDTEPSYKLADTQFILKYRQRFYRDWLVLEISPRISFPEEDHREANPGILIKFEATIGYDSDVEGYKKIFR